MEGMLGREVMVGVGTHEKKKNVEVKLRKQFLVKQVQSQKDNGGEIRAGGDGRGGDTGEKRMPEMHAQLQRSKGDKRAPASLFAFIYSVQEHLILSQST